MTRFIYYACYVCMSCVLLSVLDAEAESFELPFDTSGINREDPQYLTSYAPVLRSAKEAVVAVHSARIVRYIRQRGMDPREELLRRYFGLPTPRSSQPEAFERRFSEGVGSGVVISADGYILTNNHVITASDGDAADEILVELNDGRELSATLVGRDPRSDLAVLKVDAKDLPFVSIADSEQLEVGDIVFAIGNPMGIGLTITQGIVSATKRSNLSILGESGYESFIQTDAPINPGNSGGALVDAYGRLVGINTAIVSQSGGSIGLGFAIPSRFARSIALALVRDGEVRRGILGVSLEDLNEAYAEAFQVPEGVGVLIQSVVEGLPAEQAGLRAGDVILAINGISVPNIKELRLQVGACSPGESIEVRFRREGKMQSLDVVLADPNRALGAPDIGAELFDGVEVALLDDVQRRAYGLASEFNGLVVLSVAEDSDYADSFAPGLVIMEINGVVPESLAHARELLNARVTSRLYVYYHGHVAYLAIRP
jgi:serine protease Do/serine protease DegQ